MAPHCHQVIQDHLAWCSHVIGRPHEVCHLFGNLLQLFPTEYEQSDDFHTKVAACSCSRLDSLQFCHSHGQMCDAPSVIDYDASGLPCQDNSQAGNQQKEQGRTNVVYITWARFHVLQMTVLLCVENTPDSLSCETCFVLSCTIV
jgi:hypothetical protein